MQITVSQAAKILTEAGIFSLLSSGRGGYVLRDQGSSRQTTHMTAAQVVAFAEMHAATLGLSV
jgi:hypothetical protein